jgi:hypothetical protein
MDERLQFVARRLNGEPMAELCREFGISRKTGYKIFDRYQECGVEELTDRSRRPIRYAKRHCIAWGKLTLMIYLLGPRLFESQTSQLWWLVAPVQFACGSSGSTRSRKHFCECFLPSPLIFQLSANH